MEVQYLINANKAARKLANIDIHNYILKNPKKWDSAFLSEVINQYQILQKLKSKIPSWFAKDKIIGASLLNMEQCSSEITAKYKFDKLQGNLAVDLTGGFGVDSFFLAQKFEKVIYCESNKALTEIVKHNFKHLGLRNVTFVNQTAEEFLANTKDEFDLIYLDPDRRNESNKKLFLLENCSPNLLEINELLLQKSIKCIIKLSPILDISLASRQITNVNHIEILAHKNEVKELLFTMEKKDRVSQISATNLSKRGIVSFNFSFEEEALSESKFSEPQKYIYVPNAAILKAGAFKIICQKFEVYKIAQHSHFYTSLALIDRFPGKAFTIVDEMPFSSKNIKRLTKTPFNVLARNFPINSETIIKKYRLKTGGDKYLIFTTNHKKEKIILSCIRIF